MVEKSANRFCFERKKKVNTNIFSVDYYKEALRVHINKNKDVMRPIHAANSYYRSVVSASLYENRRKSLEIIERLRNLDQAYNEIREELRQSEQD
jgi:hypothetical protein